MLTSSQHTETIHEIIRENLAHHSRFPFPGFWTLLESVLTKRIPTTNSLPWLLLPIFACEAVDGDVRRAHHVAAALETGRIAAGCLDEWQDQDTHDALWRTLGPARTVNLATAMIPLSFGALGRLAELGVEAPLILELHEEFETTLLHMCAGQDADLSDDLPLDDYEQVARAKSGSLFGLGCRAGALVAGASPELAAQYADFGTNLGIVVQMWNDLEGLMGARGKGDAKHQRTLPLVALQAFEGAEQPLQDEGQMGALYTLVQLQVFHQRAAEALARCPAPGRLSIFLDGYSTRRLVEGAGLAPRGEENYA